MALEWRKVNYPGLGRDVVGDVVWRVDPGAGPGDGAGAAALSASGPVSSGGALRVTGVAGKRVYFSARGSFSPASSGSGVDWGSVSPLIIQMPEPKKNITNASIACQ